MAGRYWYSLGLLLVTAYSQPTVKDYARNVSYVGSFSVDGYTEHFRGVPYGKDTSGQYRFAPPRAADIVAGTIVNATQPGTACPQLLQDIPPAFFKPTKIGEDCLNLFIARPANISSNASLPVLAWLHGGGFMYGSGDDAHTAPDRLIALSVELQQPVLFVGINYRLSMFGFAASDELKSQKSENVGLRDQRLALDWVQQHIEAFGGDPKRITAYGLSAGGTALSFQHVAFGGEKGVPFKQAYMMSGPTGTSRYQATSHIQNNTANVAKRLNCPTIGDEMLSCLRQVDMSRLIEVSYEYAIERTPPLGLHTHLPVVDDDFLPDRASRLLETGRFAKGIPAILAWTEDDGAMNIGPAHLAPHEEGLVKLLQPWIGGELNDTQVQRLLELYPVEDFKEEAQAYNAVKPEEAPDVSPHWYRGSKYVRDFLFVCASIHFTYSVYRNSMQTQFDNVRMYQLNQSVMTPMLQMMGMGYVGTAHGSDTHYIFNGVFPEGSVDDNDLKLARRFVATLVNFAYTGNPVEDNSETFEDWPVAYHRPGDEAEVSMMPSEIDLLVVGGPHGTNPVHLTRSSKSSTNAPIQYPHMYGPILDGLQQALGVIGLGKMGTAKQMEAKLAVEKQKIFERCEFINSLSEALSI